MKIAILSDVHGNLPALERFLGCVRGRVGGYVCLGDVVNYGPWSNECLQVIHGLPNVVFIEGNHERLFLGSEDISKEIPLVQEFFRHSKLGFTRKDLIVNLPRSHRLGTFVCVHTIDGLNIYPDTTYEPRGDYFIGHTHHQFHLRRSGGQIVNCGSIGQNRRYIDLINYAVFDTESGDVELCAEPYDFRRFVNELIAREYPRACLDYYLKKPRAA